MRSKYQASSRHIEQIKIHGLFGRLSYVIPVPPDPVASDDIVILYGDNGCGKTTLLRLVYRLLSPEPRSGHRTYISSIPFLHLHISFNDGLTIEVYRPDLHTSNYKIVVRESQEVASVEYFLVYDSDSENDSADEYCMQLNSLGVQVAMLGEDRLAAVNSNREGPYIRHRDREGVVLYDHSHRQIEDQSIVELAIKGASDWAQRAVIDSFNEGQVSTERIYRDVVQRLVGYSDDGRDLSGNHDDFRALLQNVSNRLEHVSSSGLMPSKIAHETVTQAMKAPSSRIATLRGVLEPFVNSLAARLDALSQIENVIWTFTSTLSDFFVDKEVVYDPREGFLILLDSARDGTRELLSPSLLSSGERQLLMLFCTVLSQRDSSGIIIVDEPEISLNTLWQRRLVDSLLRCSQGARIQFLFATHSTAILSQFDLNSKEMRVKEGQDLFGEFDRGEISIYDF